MSIGPVAGVDVSKRFSDMCVLAPDNSVFRRAKIYHDLVSMQRSLTALQDAEKEFGAKPVIYGVNIPLSPPDLAIYERSRI